MQRYIVDNEKLILDEGDKRHIINVMRMKIDDTFEIVYNKTIYLCKITNIDKKDFSYEVINELKSNNEKKVKVILLCSIIKEQKMDFLIQKATELGVDEIVPVISERTVVKINDKKDNKINRWNKIIKEATEQSHRLEMPKLHEITSLKHIESYDNSLKIVCNTQELSKNIKKVLQDNRKDDTIVIVVGPEGGFSSREIDFLVEKGFISVTLGENIFRAETVPLYLLSVISYEFLR